MWQSQIVESYINNNLSDNYELLWQHSQLSSIKVTNVIRNQLGSESAQPTMDDKTSWFSTNNTNYEHRVKHITDTKSASYKMSMFK